MSLPFEKIHCKWRDVIHYESKLFEDIVKASFYMVLCFEILNWRIKAYPQACKKGIKSIRWRMFTHFIFDTYIRGFQLVATVVTCVLNQTKTVAVFRLTFELA